MILRDICTRVDYGYTTSATEEPVGPKFLRITDIVPELIDWDSVPHCEIPEAKLKKYRLREGDIVIARTGATTGYAKYIKGEHDAVFASYLVRLRVAPEHDARFVGYIVESQEYKDFITLHRGGAAQPNANAQVLTSYPVDMPPVEMQRRIAGILSAYDDLIENNTRRIRLLEEMARALYREWFVHYRFPGHQNVAMVEHDELGAVPEGWEVLPIGKAVKTTGGGTPSTKKPEYWEGGEVIWFTPSDLTGSGTMFISDSERHPNAEGLAGSSAKMFPAYSVMMTSRATLGVTAINTEPACVNQGFIVCIPNERVSVAQIYFWIDENIEQIHQLAGGATFKEIRKTSFRELPITVADDDVQRRFRSQTEPLLGLIENLILKNHNLRQTRDLLLPRLVSGEIPVDAAKEELEVAA